MNLSNSSKKLVDFNKPEECYFGRPTSLTLFGNKYEVNDWAGVCIRFLKILYKSEMYRKILESYIGKHLLEKGWRIDFADESLKSKLRRPSYISGNFYAEINLSSKDIVIRIHRSCEICRITTDDIQIEYLPNADTKRN